MVNVFVVEDELSAIERIKSFGIWKNGKYRLAGTAGNGEEGLDLIPRLRVDVIITDIEMPVMDGLEMIRVLRERGIDLPVIILSCHESFEYARRAVSLGVGEYLLKDFMEEDSVRLALSKTSSFSGAISEEAKIPVPNRDKKNSRGLLDAVSRGGRVADICEGVENESFSLVFVHLDGFSIESHESEIFIDEIFWDLAGFNAVGRRSFAAYADSGNFWILIEAEGLSFAERFFSRMKSRKISVTIAVGDPFSVSSDLKEQAAAVRDIYGYRLFLGKNRIIIAESVKSIGGRNPGNIRSKIDLIKKAVHEGDSERCFMLIRELYDRDLPGMLKYNYLEWVNSRLLSIILSAEEKGEINIREVTGKDYLPVRELEMKETVSEMRQWFEDIFSRIFRLEVDDPSYMVSNRNIIKVIGIIKTRYDEDLNLDELADEIGVHKVYLSRLFRKETGRTYYDYLQSYRVCKAEGLLHEENLKMYEIASRAGFKNYDQFAVVFKKAKGMSPSEYRRSLYS